MALLICAATEKEIRALAPQLPPSLPEMQPARMRIKSGDAIFLITGVGPLNAALAIGMCFGLTHESVGAQIKIDAVLFVGLAGAFDLEQCPLRSIWRVNREIWPEYGLNDGIRVTARAFSHPLWKKESGEEVYEELALADIGDLPGASKKGEPWPACASLTVAGVSASFARRDALWNIWHAELENMEGFAAAYVAARAGVPIVEIRVVSNKVGPRGRGEKDFEGALETLGEVLPALNLIQEK